MRAGAALVVALAVAGSASADDDFENGAIIFARGSALWRVDAKGRGETQVVALPTGATGAAVRALRTDAAATVLIADIAGAWSWLALDAGSGSAAPALHDLPCAAGPAELADDGSCVICAGSADPTKAVLYNFARDKTWPLDVPVATARLVVTAAGRMLVWADADGVWSAPVGKLAAKTKQAADAPLRGFLASPDGARAVGTYTDEVYTDAHHTKPADVLMGFELDGTAARRQLGRTGVAVDWTHDAQWVLVQDGAQGCEVRATGGEYKCWNGYTVESAAPDGRWMVLLGAPKGGKSTKAKDGKQPAAEAAVQGDVPVAPPAGPVALYRGRLEGLLKEAPALIVSSVDGAAVWVPARPAAP
jgi:hypothetical protein